jgi:hypothetical protein
MLTIPTLIQFLMKKFVGIAQNGRGSVLRGFL